LVKEKKQETRRALEEAMVRCGSGGRQVGFAARRE
jgi:hypothetical protein